MHKVVSPKQYPMMPAGIHKAVSPKQYTMMPAGIHKAASPTQYRGPSYLRDGSNDPRGSWQLVTRLLMSRPKAHLRGASCCCSWGKSARRVLRRSACLPPRLWQECTGCSWQRRRSALSHVAARRWDDGTFDAARLCAARVSAQAGPLQPKRAHPSAA
jgi:hypothetical protein